MTGRARCLSAVAIIWSVAACHWTEPRRDRLQSVVQAIALPPGIGPRFSAGFQVRFGAGSVIATDNVEALTAASQIARNAASRTPQAIHDYALVQVLLGQYDDAIASLERISAAESSWSVWNDLAGVYLLSGHTRADTSHEQWLHALDAALRATERAPENADTWFNRALSIDRAGLLSAEDAWAVYRSFAGEADPTGAAVSTATTWSVVRTQLDALNVPLDAAAVAKWLPRFTQSLREHLSDQLLPAWGAATDVRLAESLLGRADLIAAALAGANGDLLPKAAVDAIRSSHGPERARLARAFVEFGRGRTLYAKHDYSAAASAFAAATELLEPRHHPFSLWSRTHHALCLYYLRQGDAMTAELSAVLRSAPAGYRALRARAEWAAAPPAFARGESDVALRHLNRSRQLFEQSNEAENAASVAFVAAETLRQLGDDRAAWTALSRALPLFADVQQPLMRYQLLFVASLLAGHYELHYASLYLQDLALREGRREGHAIPVVEGLTRRAERRLRVGDRPGASKDLALATIELSRVASPELAGALQDAIDTVAADLLAEDHLEPATMLLERAAAHRRTTSPAEVPRLLLRLGRLAMRRGDRGAALQHIELGIDAFEQRRRGVMEEAQRVSFLDEGWDLYADRLAMRRDAGASSAELFRLTEEAKGRVLRELLPVKAPSPTIDQVQQRLSGEQAVISYSLGPAKTIAWVITSSGHHMVLLAADPAQLARLVTEYRTLLALDREDPGLAGLSRQLFDLLLAPLQGAIGKRSFIAIVPDGILHALPFSTLLAPSGRFVVEDTEVVVAPNASVLLQSAARMRRMTGPPRSAFVIGDPDFDRQRFPQLSRLTNARAEAMTVRGLYPSGQLTLGRDATPALFRAAAGSHDVLHFAGHALENPRYPWRSALLLADSDGDGGLLYGQQIARLDLSHVRVVTLAACETGIGRLYRGEGIVSLATPFLAAGVPIVVSTLWEVDDRAARVIFEKFHQELANGASPAAALHAAQRSLASRSNVQRSPRDWGAYVIVGGMRLGS